MNEINPYPAQGPLVLAVDDDSAVLRVIEAHLLRANYLVQTASSGREAMEILNTLTPAVLILDVMMPEMTGFEVCHFVKAEKRLRDIPVIFLTARDTPKDFKKGHELGAVIYMAKPFKPDRLARVVQLLAPAPEETPRVPAKR